MHQSSGSISCSIVSNAEYNKMIRVRLIGEGLVEQFLDYHGRRKIYLIVRKTSFGEKTGMRGEAEEFDYTTNFFKVRYEDGSEEKVHRIVIGSMATSVSPNSIFPQMRSFAFIGPAMNPNYIIQRRR
jgi:hypothetical protein